MARNKKGIPVHGWVNIDKPLGITSNQVLGRLRRALNAQKLGHAGTLDPLATGILPVALGEATKTIPFVQDRDKVYRFTVRWGEERATDDAEGDVTQTASLRPSREEVLAVIPRFIGAVTQTPPQFSAIKIDGQRAYAMARAGEEVNIRPRTVLIHDLRLLNVTADSAEFELFCGKGTYVRAVARDMGRILGCFGHVSRLRRTAVGHFSEENAISLDVFEKMVLSSAPDLPLLPVETALDDIPALAITESEISRIRQGQSLRLLSRSDFSRLETIGAADGDVLLALGCDGPVALLERNGPDLHPVRVFNL